MIKKEENEYFIPQISDIRVGYECELNGSGLAGGMDNWIIDIAKSPINLRGLEIMLEAGCLRVPYLTKDQIESEGWKMTNLLIGEFDVDIEKAIVEFSKEEHILQFDPVDHHLTLTSGGGILYKGKCKDVNTLRWICKLLNII